MPTFVTAEVVFCLRVVTFWFVCLFVFSCSVCPDPNVGLERNGPSDEGVPEPSPPSISRRVLPYVRSRSAQDSFLFEVFFLKHVCDEAPSELRVLSVRPPPVLGVSWWKSGL